MIWRASGLACLAAAAIFAQPVAKSVASMVNGQTLRVDGHVVRLEGVPMLKEAAGSAALHLAALVQDRRVACRIDGARAGDALTARCEAGGTDLTTALVAGGSGETRTDPPRQRQAAPDARSQSPGVWASR
jgi:endonuclease YncB( thermonuclease family)